MPDKMRMCQPSSDFLVEKDRSLSEVTQGRGVGIRFGFSQGAQVFPFRLYWVETVQYLIAEASSGVLIPTDHCLSVRSAQSNL